MADRIEIVSKDYLGNQLSKYHNEVIKPNYAKSDGSVADESKVWSSNDFTDEMKMNVDQYVSLNDKVDTVASQVNALSTSVADGILPATETRIGGVIVGENLNIDDDGVLGTNIVPVAYSDLQDDSDWYDSYKINDLLTDLSHGRVLKGYRDNQPIPDYLTTGCQNMLHIKTGNEPYKSYTDPGASITNFTASGKLGELVSYKDSQKNQPYFTLSSSKVTLDLSVTNNVTMAHHVRVYSRDFSNYDFETINADSLENIIMSTRILANAQATCRIIEFRNCKFKTFKYNVNEISRKLRFKFFDCTFTGQVSGSNMKFYNCLFKDSVNAYANVHICNSYFADFDTTGSSRGGINAINICSSPNYTTRNILVKNVRFTLPTSKSGSDYINKCINIMPTNNGTARISIENIIIDIAGKNNTIFHSGRSTYNQSTTMFKGIMINQAYNKDNLFDTTDYYNEQTEMGFEYGEGLYVSSAIKEYTGSGGTQYHCKTHIMCTNMTNTARTLKIVTNIGVFTYTIPASVSQTQINGGATYGAGVNYDCELSTAVKYAVCYDEDGRQIRFFNLDSRKYVYLPTPEKQGIAHQKALNTTTLTCNPDTIYDLGDVTGDISITFNIPQNATGTEIYHGRFKVKSNNVNVTFSNSDNSSLTIKKVNSFIIQNEYEFSMLGNVVVMG